jgi:hypothetical protein
MEEYKALVAYLSVPFIIFIGGLLWGRHRTYLKRKMNIRDYREAPPDKDQHSNHTHTPVGV